MSLILDYLDFVSGVEDVHHISVETFNFINKNITPNLSLLLHMPDPEALRVLKSNSDNDINKWLEKFKNIANDTSGTTRGNTFFSSGEDFLKSPVYIFTLDKELIEVSEILSTWQRIYIIIKNTVQSAEENISNTQGNLISQLLHDVQSLMELSKGSKKDFSKRIEYQKKVNKNLLFFVRDFDLFKSHIKSTDFLRDALSIEMENIDNFKVELDDQDLELYVDVELFSVAFSEIVKNALFATENRYSDVQIGITKDINKSPFLENDWIIITIKNRGKEIPEDYMSYLTKPFFTTHKQEGHTGFGLSNAEKIIKAHHGKLEIKSSDGTEIRIYLPQIINE